MLGNIIGHKLIEMNEVDSTNSFASRLLFDQQVSEGTVIAANFQNAGKGQRGSSWESDKDQNLLVSYILFPSFLSPLHHFELNQMFSLAVHGFLQSLTKAEITIKWPNDIMAGDKKIAGLLIENSIRNNLFISTIAGTGININQRVFNKFDPEATSLALLESKSFQLKKCLLTLNDYINKWYTVLQSGNSNKIAESYSSHLYRKNKTARYESMGVDFTGVIKGVSNAGKLIITHSETGDIEFMNKEVKFLY